MPLPQQVIDRLSKESPKTEGWLLGGVTFSGAVLFIAVALYLGLTFGYEPYIDSRITDLNAKISALTKSVSTDDQTKLVTFYSQVSNVSAALTNHVIFTRFLSWLEQHTVVNVSYSRLNFSSSNQVTMNGLAKTEGDINQQVAIFESSPEISSVSVTNISLSETTGMWQFAIALSLNTPAIIRVPK